MKKVVIEDLLKFKFVRNLSFNESGNHYVYEVGYANDKKDGYDAKVYVDKKELKEDKSVSVVGWYDDINILITTKGSKKSVFNNYYLLNVETLNKKLLIKTPLNINSIKKINDDNHLISAGIDARYPDLYLYDESKLKKHKEKMKEEADYEVLDELPYWMNGAGFVNKKRRALFILNNKKLKRITDKEFNTECVTVDSNLVYFTGNSYNRHSPLFSKAYKYNVENKKTTCIYNKEDQMISNIFVFNNELYLSSTDGKKYGVNETSKFYKLINNELTYIKTPDRSLYDAVAVDTTLGGGKSHVIKNNVLYTLATEKDHVEIWKFDKDFNYKKLISMPLISFFDVNDEKIIYCGSDESNLPELYEYNLKTRKTKQLTSYNKQLLKGKYIAKPQEINYVSEGIELNGWVLPPINYNKKKKYPAVLDVHGGPRAIYSKAFFHEMQVWASEGYFVMFTNIRGSDGRGDKFADIRGKYGYIDYQNLMDFVDAVLAKYPAIDKNRLCETGGSYGGFMTNWIISHTDRFVAAASQRSISNWIGFTYLSDIGPYFAIDQNKTNDGIKDYKKLWEHSPLKYVDNVKTPTLFIHSDEDYRCPLPEGMQMMQALAERNIETRLVVFHKENHELSRGGQPKHRIRRLKEITDWFNKHTK